MWTKPLFYADLITFTEEILIGKLFVQCNLKASCPFNFTSCVLEALGIWPEIQISAKKCPDFHLSGDFI